MRIKSIWLLHWTLDVSRSRISLKVKEINLVLSVRPNVLEYTPKQSLNTKQFHCATFTHSESYTRPRLHSIITHYIFKLELIQLTGQETGSHCICPTIVNNNQWIMTLPIFSKTCVIFKVILPRNRLPINYSNLNVSK